MSDLKYAIAKSPQGFVCPCSSTSLPLWDLRRRVLCCVIRREMHSSVIVPAVKSCSSTIMRLLVRILMETPRDREARMAVSTGGEVKFGVINVMLPLAV